MPALLTLPIVKNAAVVKGSPASAMSNRFRSNLRAGALALGQKPFHCPQTVGLLLAVGFILLLASPACVGTGQSSSAYPAMPIVPEGQKGFLAPDFAITVDQGADVLGGEKVRFSDLLAQGQPIVLNFWAGLCPPCRAEMPDLQEMYDEYQGRVLLFGLDVGSFVSLGSTEDGRALLEELKVTYPAGTTFEPKVVREYQILGMPTTLFIKPNGEVIRNWAGLLNKQKMEELVEELLAASTQS
jgi:thiol-disulfide isomerase/thioredoxin